MVKHPAEKRLILCLTVPVSGNYTPFSGPSDMFSDNLVTDGPEKGEYLQIITTLRKFVKVLYVYICIYHLRFTISISQSFINEINTHLFSL